MKIEELRIGSLVRPVENISFPEHAEGHVVPRVGKFACLKVCAIHPSSVTIEASWGSKLFIKEVLIEDIAPIPITKDALLRCGFGEVGMYENVCHKDNFRVYIDAKASDGLLKYETDDFHIEIEISSLHQLQNAIFSITGEELKVEL